MNALEYQVEAMKTAVYRNKLYPFLGLAEEAGEVCGKAAKSLRKRGELDPEVYESVIAELGDVLWMVAACCTEVGVSMELVMVDNLRKLKDRQKRNVIEGEGDNR